MHVAVPANHPLAEKETIDLERLATEPWLCGTADGSCRQLTIRSCQLAGFEPDVSFESNDYNVIQGLVAAGMGVTLLPDLALVSPHPGIVVIPVAPEAPIRRVWAATLRAGSRSRATEAMVDVLEEVSARFGAARSEAAAAA